MASVTEVRSSDSRLRASVAIPIWYLHAADASLKARSF